MNMDEALTEVKLAQLGVDAAKEITADAASTMNAAVLEAVAAGATPTAIARAAGVDRTTIAKRIERAALPETEDNP